MPSLSSASQSKIHCEAELFHQAAKQGIEALRLSKIESQEHLLIGVSGGRDSIALIHFLSQVLHWKNLVVVHLNHQLRSAESDADAEFVKNLASSWQLPFESRNVAVTNLAEEQACSIETAARLARDTFFAELSQKYVTPYVFLAHHADDQLETTLSNLLRGTSPKGFLGMKMIHPMQNGLIKVRPLLKVRRDWIQAYLTAHDIPHRDDASNAIADVRRNRLRLEVIPLLSEIFQRDIANTVSGLSKLLQEDGDFFDQEVARWFTSPTFFDPLKPLEIRMTEEFKTLHPAIRHRLLFHWLQNHAKVSDLSQALIQTVASMLLDDGPAKINLPRNLHLRRKSKRLFIEVSKR